MQFYTFDTCKGMVEERFPSLSNSWKNGQLPLLREGRIEQCLQHNAELRPVFYYVQYLTSTITHNHFLATLSFTHTLAHSITHSFTHSLTYRLTHTLTHSLTHPLATCLQSCSDQLQCGHSVWRCCRCGCSSTGRHPNTFCWSRTAKGMQGNILSSSAFVLVLHVYTCIIYLCVDIIIIITVISH